MLMRDSKEVGMMCVRTEPAIAGFEDGGRVPSAKKCGQPLKAGGNCRGNCQGNCQGKSRKLMLP